MSILRDELALAVYISMSSAEATAALNAQTVPIKQPIPVHDIQQYLVLTDLLLPIEAGLSVACRSATRALQIFESFDMANPMIAGKLSLILDGLIADGIGFTDAHKTTILSMGDTFVSRASELGLGSVNEGQVQEAKVA